jgi:magnesium transporter
MLSLHLNQPGEGLTDLPQDADTASQLVWIDLVHPTREEEHRVEAYLTLSLPTREDMAEIETSSRLYVDSGAAYMTANVAFFGGSEILQSGPVTFVMTPKSLVTIRYIEPRSFDIFLEHCARQPGLKSTPAEAFVGMLDVVVDRTADLIEKTAEGIDAQSHAIFRHRRVKPLEDVVIDLGRAQSDMAKIRDSLVSFGRLIAFARALDDAILGDMGPERKEIHEHMKTMAQDIASLSDHASYVSNNIVFLLDAALGLINVEQNNTVRLLSIVTVVFLPLTLIASIYGMNFAHIPFSQGPGSFEIMLGIMAVMAVGLLIWFKKRKWL